MPPDRRRRVLALLLALLLAGPASAQPAPAKPPARHPWHVTLFQVDNAGTLVGNPIDFACPGSGCEQAIRLDVLGRPYRFLVAITVVPAGAYFALQPLQPEIKGVIGFEEGYIGPQFLQLRQHQRFNTTLRYVLTGPAMAAAEGQGVQLMPNESSLVFHRKLMPDLTLKVSMEPVEKAPAKQPAAAKKPAQ